MKQKKYVRERDDLINEAHYEDRELKRDKVVSDDDYCGGLDLKRRNPADVIFEHSLYSTM